MSLWEYILLFFSVIIGGGLAFFLEKSKHDYLHLILSFSGAYILGITVLHLLPTVYHDSSAWIGMWILGGFFIQLMLEQLSRGVEHGHIHSPHHAHTGFALQVLLGLSIHAFIEGMPLGYYEQLHSGHAGHDHSHLLIGIILHKAPAAFALIVLMLVAKYSRYFIISCLVVFALMSPLGAGLGEILDANGLLDPVMMRNIIALVVGSFLHIATTILFEQDSTRHHNISISKLIAILAGFGMAMLTMH